MEFFTQQHFDLLNKYHSQKNDKSNDEHNEAYKVLGEAYQLVHTWANNVKNTLFDQGKVDIRKAPTNQAQQFASYLWAKVYPKKDSPKELAYTVAINTDGLDVKIDTVGLNDKDPKRLNYLEARGQFSKSGIVSTLSIEDCLAMDMEQLLQWTKKQIESFTMSYDEVTNEIGLNSGGEFPHIEKCKASPAFDKFLSKKGLNKLAFDDAIRVVHQAEPRFDLYNINKASSALRFGNKESAQKSGKVAGLFLFEERKLKLFFSKRYDREEPVRLILSDDLEENEQLIIEALQKQYATFKENGLCGKSRWPKDYGEAEAIEEDDSEDAHHNVTPLNQILYGPPGTGKTYYTIQASVNAAEPEFESKSRADLKKKYDELVAEKRIRFITFHQSYGYEEFVEGLRANSDDGKISYDVEPGIFKELCTVATENIKNDSNSDFFEDFNACWGAFLSEFMNLEDDSGITIKTKKSSFIIKSFTNKTIYFEKSNGDRSHTLAIKTLIDVFYGKRVIKGGLSVYYKPFIEHLKLLGNSLPVKPKIRKNYALIIDEINRGNISKIFGELITLIEGTKRSGEGQDEALEVVLPNSGDPFTVPNNLYLIGTMNTADRSLAMMDTALRRRFDFVEMIPKPELFNDVIVKGIDLELLLSKMNQRIEVLYDREHTLGHAFFMPVKALVGDQDRAFNELRVVFKNKIIPLLEEYFFEDWNKIRLVLGDNQKAEDLQFISEEKQSFDSLFGNDHGLNSYQQEEKSYRLLPFDNDVWNSPEAYIGIYKATKED